MDASLVEEQKREIRDQAHASRVAQRDKDKLSRVIMQRLFSLPEFEVSRTIMFYIDVRDEVRTRFDIPSVIDSQKQVFVPYCQGDDLELCRLADMSELATGRFGVLEPLPDVRQRPGRRVSLEQLDLIVAPGVAFDRHGSRMGHGMGFYDRLLASAAAETTFVGLAFECQVFHQIPVEEHDISMDRVITESTIYIGRGH